MAEVRVALSETTKAEVDIEGVLDFAQELFLDPAKMWRNLNPAQRRIFQGSIFPEGVTFDGEFNRTPVTASFVAQLRDFQGGETCMASPTGVSSNFRELVPDVGGLQELFLLAA